MHIGDARGLERVGKFVAVSVLGEYGEHQRLADHDGLRRHRRNDRRLVVVLAPRKREGAQQHGQRQGEQARVAHAIHPEQLALQSSLAMETQDEFQTSIQQDMSTLQTHDSTVVSEQPAPAEVLQQAEGVHASAS